MMYLNESLNWTQVEDSVRRTFRGCNAVRVLLEANHQLYKFSEYPLVDPASGQVTPYWSSIDPLSENDSGWTGMVQRSERIGVEPVKTARARAAVRWKWNRMTGELRARLKVPAFAFFGQCSGQPTEDDSNVYFIGGAWQLYIPNLTESHIAGTS